MRGYLPGFEEREDVSIADWRFRIDRKIRIPQSAIRNWKSRSPYRGAFGDIVETEEYENSGKCIKAILIELSRAKG